MVCTIAEMVVAKASPVALNLFSNMRFTIKFNIVAIMEIIVGVRVSWSA